MRCQLITMTAITKNSVIPFGKDAGASIPTMRNQRRRKPATMPVHYHRIAITLHWLIAVLLLGQFLFGWYLGDVPRNTPERGFFINLHKSTGLLIGLLILLRIVWRLTHTPPPLPASTPRWQRRAANISHGVLYACMLLMPLSGYLASNFSKYGVKLFNMVRLAPWGSDDKVIYAFFNQTHKLTALVLGAFVLLHILAVLKHQLIDRDNLISRMWPRATRPPF
jgi:cytochrome b561